MRNIVAVIDKILSVIPDDQSMPHLRAGLDNIKDSAKYSAPESMYFLWQRGAILLWKEFNEADYTDLTGWHRSVVDIWMDKK